MSEQEREDRLDRKDLKDRKAHRDRQERRDRFAMKERWSYVILAVIMAVLVLGLGAFMINYIKTTNRAWCEIIHISTPSIPPVKPPDPNANPTQEKRYEGYEALRRLSNRFGCS